ncbi:hypothetical protein UNH65_21080 [Chitinophaga sp. 180180018-2]|nr:hypothetical protein [Chitinophaga sp. 212800010-3]
MYWQVSNLEKPFTNSGIYQTMDTDQKILSRHVFPEIINYFPEIVNHIKIAELLL